jgi:hypothetical protein
MRLALWRTAQGDLRQLRRDVAVDSIAGVRAAARVSPRTAAFLPRDPACLGFGWSPTAMPCVGIPHRHGDAAPHAGSEPAPRQRLPRECGPAAAGHPGPGGVRGDGRGRCAPAVDGRPPRHSPEGGSTTVQLILVLSLPTLHPVAAVPRHGRVDAGQDAVEQARRAECAPEPAAAHRPLALARPHAALSGPTALSSLAGILFHTVVGPGSPGQHVRGDRVHSLLLVEESHPGPVRLLPPPFLVERHPVVERDQIYPPM